MALHAGCEPAVTITVASNGPSNACILTQTGNLYCWLPGKFDWNSGYLLPPSDLGPVLKVSIGDYAACAIMAADNTLRCWDTSGLGNNYGIIGDQIPSSVTTVKDVSVSQMHICAVSTDGIALCWGYFGIMSWLTTPPSDIGEVLSVSAASDHNCVVTVAKKAVCWGLDHDRQSSGASALADVSAVITGPEGTCATALSDNKLTTCWGRNDWGQATVPKAVVENSVSQSTGHSCAIDASTQNAVCWGMNDVGQTDVPSGLGPVISVSVGLGYSCAVTVLGSVECWGTSFGNQNPAAAAPRCFKPPSSENLNPLPGQVPSHLRISGNKNTYSRNDESCLRT